MRGMDTVQPGLEERRESLRGLSRRKSNKGHGVQSKDRAYAVRYNVRTDAIMSDQPVRPAAFIGGR